MGKDIEECVPGKAKTQVWPGIFQGLGGRSMAFRVKERRARNRSM